MQIYIKEVFIVKKSSLIISMLIVSVLSSCGNTPSNSSSNPQETSSQNSSISLVHPYYSNIDFSKSGSALKNDLHNLISNFTNISYKALWNAFRDTDARDNGKVWDMYSNCNYTFGTDQNSGTNGPEGTNYNREHSIPKSWFGGEVYPMYSDLFHLYPTDSKVNSERGNLPYGEVGSASYTSGNGSKVGTSSFSGYSGTVFEPIDEYKGDFARTYFHFATCYQDQDIAKVSEAKVIFKSEAYPTLTTYAQNLFMKWSKEDPVSKKEIDRNNAVYNYQHNRNPFIDYPGLEDKIWG